MTQRETTDLIEAARSIRDRAILTLMVDTGLRRCEVCDLLIGDVSLESGHLTVRNGKGGKMRLVPLSARTQGAIRPLLKPALDCPLFLSERRRGLTTRQLNRIVARAGKASGIANPNPRYGNITCHLLRHTFARHWKDVGGSIETLAKILGHASVKTTWDLYGTQSIDDIKRNYHQIISKMTSAPAGEA